MSEILKTVPHQKEYIGEKKELGKEALQKTIEEIKSLDANQTMKKLLIYKTTKPGIDSKDNTFEMMALYQRAIQLLGGSTLAIDARFGTETYKALIKTQRETLKFTGKNIDGLPGPTTTAALITALEGKNKAENIDLEKKKVLEIIENAKKPSMITLSGKGSYYNGSAPKLIDYAAIKQPDEEYYIYDKPVDGSRMVYRTRTNNDIISISQITDKGVVTSVKGTPMKNLQYQPTPIAQ